MEDEHTEVTGLGGPDWTPLDARWVPDDLSALDGAWAGGTGDHPVAGAARSELRSGDAGRFWEDLQALSGPPRHDGDLRSSLAICELLVASVLRREGLGAEATAILELVVHELATDLAYVEGRPA